MDDAWTLLFAPAAMLGLGTVPPAVVLSVLFVAVASLGWR